MLVAKILYLSQEKLETIFGLSAHDWLASLQINKKITCMQMPRPHRTSAGSPRSVPPVEMGAPGSYSSPATPVCNRFKVWDIPRSRYVLGFGLQSFLALAALDCSVNFCEPQFTNRQHRDESHFFSRWWKGLNTVKLGYFVSAGKLLAPCSS